MFTNVTYKDLGDITINVQKVGYPNKLTSCQDYNLQQLMYLLINQLNINKLWNLGREPLK